MKRLIVLVAAFALIASAEAGAGATRGAGRSAGSVGDSSLVNEVEKKFPAPESAHQHTISHEAARLWGDNYIANAICAEQEKESSSAREKLCTLHKQATVLTITSPPDSEDAKYARPLLHEDLWQDLLEAKWACKEADGPTSAEEVMSVLYNRALAAKDFFTRNATALTKAYPWWNGVQWKEVQKAILTSTLSIPMATGAVSSNSGAGVNGNNDGLFFSAVFGSQGNAGGGDSEGMVLSSIGVTVSGVSTSVGLTAGKATTLGRNAVMRGNKAVRTIGGQTMLWDERVDAHGAAYSAGLIKKCAEADETAKRTPY